MEHDDWISGNRAGSKYSPRQITCPWERKSNPAHFVQSFWSKVKILQLIWNFRVRVLYPGLWFCLCFVVCRQPLVPVYWVSVQALATTPSSALEPHPTCSPHSLVWRIWRRESYNVDVARRPPWRVELHLLILLSLFSLRSFSTRTGNLGPPSSLSSAVELSVYECELSLPYSARPRENHIESTQPSTCSPLWRAH